MYNIMVVTPFILRDTAYLRGGSGAVKLEEAAMESETVCESICSALEKYPLSEPRDIVKLLYQREFGPAHAIADPDAALRFLLDEYASVRQEEGPLYERIGNGYVRLNLKTLDFNRVTPEKAAEAFVKSAVPAGDRSAFAEALRTLAGNELVIKLMPALPGYVEEYVKSGCPAVHHSESYKKAYSPAYRVIREEFIAE